MFGSQLSPGLSPDGLRLVHFPMVLRLVHLPMVLRLAHLPLVLRLVQLPKHENATTSVFEHTK
jgi:hypothetical protein